MARKPNTLPEVSHPDIDQDQINADHAKLNELAAMNRAASDNAHALAAQLGYDGSLTVGALEDEIRFYQARSVEAVLELGKRLIILKELTPFGEFEQRAELLGIDCSLARKFMAATLKFSKRETFPVLKSAKSQSKMLELLVLDDGEIAALADGESARGLKLDDIETMSVRELKAALRAAQADATATDRVLEEKSKSITKLQKEIAGKTIDPQAEWSEAMMSLNAHVAAHRDGFVQSITALDVIRQKVMEQEAEAGAEAALAAAREQIGRELGEAIERAEGIVAAVRRSFDLTLGALIG
ncbi:MAG: hypothetical protein PXX73_04710 [Sideroxydans sp.]|nr:hypothetical protein [Sideroxydans sp.]